jgi:hypothetical protein
MASIYKEIDIDVDSLKVWESVRDIGNVHIRLVPGYAAETRIDGDTRILTMSNGNVVKELIVDIDDRHYRLAYAVKETQMPITHHHASFQVFSEGENSCRLVWITDILPHELEPEVRARVDRGAVVIKHTLENNYANKK